MPKLYGLECSWMDVFSYGFSETDGWHILGHSLWIVSKDHFVLLLARCFRRGFWMSTRVGSQAHRKSEYFSSYQRY